MAKRRSVSTRKRFEVFKRDDFTCRYCGRKSPDVILELDHIIAVASGGSEDEMNLATSCAECNRGKSDKPLSVTIAGSDAHDKAVEILEKERELREYEQVRRGQEDRRKRDWDWLAKQFRLSDSIKPYLRSALTEHSVFDVAEALQIAIDKTGGTDPGCTKYFCGIVRNWKERTAAIFVDAVCFWCSQPLNFKVPTDAIMLCNHRCWRSAVEAISRGDVTTEGA